MKLSCVIPAHNESECIERVIKDLISRFEDDRINYEIIIVNDNSSDNSAEIINRIVEKNDRVKTVHRKEDVGFGKAVKAGMEVASGEAICVVMGDASDDPEDVVKLFQKLQEGYDVVYGSRFIKGSKIYDYPILKLMLNRFGNHFIRLIFSMVDEKDITNAFKIYRREVIQSIHPIESSSFNITLELPLKAELKGFRRTAIPVRWYGRQSDVSKFSIFKMCRFYFGTLTRLWFLKISKSWKGES